MSNKDLRSVEESIPVKTAQARATLACAVESVLTAESCLVRSLELLKPYCRLLAPGDGKLNAQEHAASTVASARSLLLDCLTDLGVLKRPEPAVAPESSENKEPPTPAKLEIVKP